MIHKGKLVNGYCTNILAIYFWLEHSDTGICKSADSILHHLLKDLDSYFWNVAIFGKY